MIKINYNNIEEEIRNPKGTPLEYKEFEEYYIKSKCPGQWLFKFNNDYGASVVKHFGSYGYEEDLFELAVIYWENNRFTLTYNTPITHDVIGHLSNEEVMKYLKQIKELIGDLKW